MPRGSEDARKNSRNVALHIGASFPAAWENVLLPWFESVALPAIANEEPVVVVTPFSSNAAFLRAKLLEHRVSLLGIKFVTPAQLRELLLGDGEPRLPLREHLRLLLSIAAEQFADSPSQPNDVDLSTIAKSVARAPDHLLRAIDRLSAAGWSFADAGPTALREIAKKFQELVRKCEFQMVHEADRVAVESAATSPPRFSNLLVTGFNSAHWPLWPLLRAAAASSKKATVILNDPRDEARELDEIWIGTWEETFGAAEPIAATEKEIAHPFAELTRIPETASERKARRLKPISNVQFLIGRDTTEQAKAIVALTAHFLSEESCARIGILFPGPDALARLVAVFLDAARIPHNDAIAHPLPNPLDDTAWRAWLELQENPRLHILLRFLRATENRLFGKMSIQQAEEILRRAYDAVLIDDVQILREHCAQQTDSESFVSVAQGLSQLRFLPERGTMSIFLAETRKVFQQFNWKERWSEVERLSRNWSEAISNPVSRRTYLRWLAEIISPPAIGRDDCGNHPYSRVHLLSYAAAEGQEWSHLIFAGLNEGEWPPRDDESGFIRDEEVVDLNQRIRRLNRSAVRQGRHGEGQWSVEQGKTLYLGANEQRAIAWRQCLNLVESATEKIGITANLLQESAPERVWNSSEFFLRLYFATHGRAISQSEMDALAANTSAWIKKAALFSEPTQAASSDIEQTRIAYDARRMMGTSGEYEFALRNPPERMISLRVTEWEAALKRPALVWMKIFLGVEPNDESGDAWSKSTGQWVHRWLARSVDGSDENLFVELPEPKVLSARLNESAQQFRSEVQKLCETCGRALPDWWTSGWSNALYLADRLAAHLVDLDDWSRIATEWRLGSPETISLGNNEELRVRGRIDLILARGESSDSPIGYQDLWLIDYKTGRQRSFDLRDLKRGETPEEKFHKRLARGEAVQLGLYALAVRQLGASSVQLTLLPPGGELAPQFRIEHVLAQENFWRELRRMQETGVFGMLGAVRGDYSFAQPYPLATLAVDVDLLEEKWAATHPDFVVAESGEAEA